jgi:hypothetical protein
VLITQTTLQRPRGYLNAISIGRLSIKVFQQRRQLPDGDWRLDRKPIDYAMVSADRARITNFEPLKSFSLRRDKFHAHFDKRYFFDRSKIAEDAPLKWSHLDQAMELLKDILNRYSAAYDGEVFHIEPLNVTDLNYLLDCLRKPKGAGRED